MGAVGVGLNLCGRRQWGEVQFRTQLNSGLFGGSSSRLSEKVIREGYQMREVLHPHMCACGTFGWKVGGTVDMSGPCELRDAGLTRLCSAPPPTAPW